MASDQERWVFGTWRGVGWDGPWLVSADVEILELGERAVYELRGVGVLVYRCRDIGYGVEKGITEGWFTGEREPFGKLEFREVDGETLWLFDDEIVEWAR